MLSTLIIALAYFNTWYFKQGRITLSVPAIILKIDNPWNVIRSVDRNLFLLDTFTARLTSGLDTIYGHVESVTPIFMQSTQEVTSGVLALSSHTTNLLLQRSKHNYLQ